mmetsp:Transcript_134514/g.287794  ORF Transcript_134514/g.287794 Transcript_134514/m.287794 type:complete len:596 (+) Transcript_134514:75-1862(+)
MSIASRRIGIGESSAVSAGRAQYYKVVFAPRVAVRDRPSLEATVIRSFDVGTVVQLSEWDSTRQWRKIRTAKAKDKVEDPPPISDTVVDNVSANSYLELTEGWMMIIHPDHGLLLEAVLEEDAKRVLEERNSTASTGLEVIAERSNANIMQFEALAELGTKFKGEPKLIRAIFMDNYRLVRIVLANRADPNTESRDGKTALVESARRGSTSVVALLLVSLADPNSRKPGSPEVSLIAKDDKTRALIRKCQGKWADDQLVRATLVEATLEVQALAAERLPIPYAAEIFAQAKAAVAYTKMQVESSSEEQCLLYDPNNIENFEDNGQLSLEDSKGERKLKGDEDQRAIPELKGEEEQRKILGQQFDSLLEQIDMDDEKETGEQHSEDDARRQEQEDAEKEALRKQLEEQKAAAKLERDREAEASARAKAEAEALLAELEVLRKEKERRDKIEQDKAEELQKERAEATKTKGDKKVAAASPSKNEGFAPPPRKGGTQQVKEQVLYEVMRKKVIVREKPHTDSDRIMTFAQGEVVSTFGWDSTRSWRKVRVETENEDGDPEEVDGWVLVESAKLGILLQPVSENAADEEEESDESEMDG